MKTRGRKTPETKRIVISVSLYQADLDVIDAYCSKYDMNRSSLLKRSTVEFIKTRKSDSSSDHY